MRQYRISRKTKKSRRNNKKTQNQLKRKASQAMPKALRLSRAHLARPCQQTGGAAAAASANTKSYTEQDKIEFFDELARIMDNMKKFPDRRPYGEMFTGKFFFNKIRLTVNLYPKWLEMFNECKNTRDQTPLYVMLRFDAPIGFVLSLFEDFKGNIDVNRQNNDGSTPFIGLFFGLSMNAPITFSRIKFISNLLLKEGGDYNLPNYKGETGLGFLKYKHYNNLINYSPNMSKEYFEWITPYLKQ